MQYLIYPFFIALAVVGGFALTQLFAEELYILIPLIITAISVLFIILGERFLTYNPDWAKNVGDLKTDILQTFVTLPAASKLAELLIPLLLYYPILWLSKNSMSIDLIPQHGFFTQFVVALLFCEFAFYWFHRLMHQSNKLWKIHAVHHGAKRVYWVNSGRFHAIEAFLGSFFYFLPLIFFKAYPDITILIITTSAISGFLEHVNIDFKAGPLNYVFNTAEHHRWHHSKVISESNRNYGKVLIIWDLIFGTFFLPKKRQVKDVGITEDEIPNGFIAQLVHPFKRK